MTLNNKYSDGIFHKNFSYALETIIAHEYTFLLPRNAAGYLPMGCHTLIRICIKIGDLIFNCTETYARCSAYVMPETILSLHMTSIHIPENAVNY